MKKSILSMMIIGMMALGTTNSFGTVKNSHFQVPKTEKIVKKDKKVKMDKKLDKDCKCKTCKDLKKPMKKVQVNACKECNKVQKVHANACKECNKMQKVHANACKECNKMQKAHANTCKVHQKKHK